MPLPHPPLDRPTALAAGPHDRTPASDNKPQAAEDAKAARERKEESVSVPGGFKNDPDDPTDPNEAIERHRRKLRP